MPGKPQQKPLVGVSQCLLGGAVRYDGQAKPNRIILERLSQLFDFFPVCPEVEAGLSVPRPPVQLTGSISNPKITGRDDPDLDVTDLMRQYCKYKPGELVNLAGFIFKSRSPSCGLNSTPVFIDEKCVTETSRGVFAKRLCESYPELPVMEDTDLENPKRLDEFIQSVTVK
ncbi:MAG: DUF523 domain-containing protein [Gammaproteobacteria bacterium]|nr:DUF523 domain-containing protein [Gammaproteobacteria bacterium]NNJ49866.1 DUF523 domain-containing protein [Gammaproteobacteria bacterium]